MTFQQEPITTQRMVEQRNSGSALDLVVVDRTAALVELLSAQLCSEGNRVASCWSVEAALDVVTERATTPPEVALIGLAGGPVRTFGLDIALAFDDFCPETSVVLLASPEIDRRLLAVAWEALPMASVISRSASLDDLVDVLHRVKTGRPYKDDVFADILPSARSSHRSVPAYRRLVPHAGHAKLWRALLADEQIMTYKDIADHCGLSVNTVRNYRDDLLPELRLHGLDNPPMHEMQRFAQVARPLLLAAITAQSSAAEPCRFSPGFRPG